MEMNDELEYLESRLKDNPKSLLFARLADCCLEQGRIDDAFTLCSEGVKHHPYYSTGYFVLAKVYLLKKEYDKAEIELKKVLSHDQQYLSAHKLLGDILVKNGWETAAIQHYDTILEIDPLDEKVRGVLKRYAPGSAPKVAPTAPREKPAAMEQPPPPEHKAEAKAEAQIQPVPKTEPDWTDQIREFNPDENGLSMQAPPEKAEAGYPIFAETSEPQSDRMIDEPSVRMEPEPLSDLNESVSPREEKAKTVGKDASAEEIVDFTQDWFDLSSFETQEEAEKPPTENAESALDIVEAGPVKANEPEIESDFASLFEKDEPRDILAPSDLTPEKTVPAPAPERKGKAWMVPPRDEKPQSSGSAASVALHKPVEPKIQKPEKSVAQDKPPGPPVPAAKEPPDAPKNEEKSEQKIVTSTLGEIYAIQGQFEKAIQVYEALLEKNPSVQKYREKIAELRKKLKDASGK
jgi:tetratricopeptide (TPR) repeat protein